MGEVKHSLIKPGVIESRLYQETILNTAASKNTLVVLPTGLGKTYIAALLAAQRLEKNPQGKILFLAPTKPLVAQHCETWKRIFNFDEKNFKFFTGVVSPEDRVEEYENIKFVFATPQVIQNDIISNKLSLENFVLVIFDEAHHATGEYPYTYIAKKYAENAKEPRILAITASPGSTKEEINAVCRELFIDAVEIRDRKDMDVVPYVKGRNYNWIEVSLPSDFKKIKSLLESVLSEYLRFLKEGNIIPSSDKNYLRKKMILELQGKLAANASQNPDLYVYLSALAAVMKLNHATELLETQGIPQLHDYLKRLYSDRSRAAYNLLMDPHIKEAIALVDFVYKEGAKHPKMVKLLELLRKEKRAIVFAHYRASVESIMKELEKEGISAVKLIGQSDGRFEGLTQKEQIARLSEFREGKYRVLVATSVGEEGLDIPEVEHVIFYEPVPSAIRSIQRSGRTARHAPGKISILITKETRDTAYYWSAYKKEKNMKKILRQNGFKPVKQKTLDKYSDTQRVVIFADNREAGSGVLKELHDLGVEVRIKRLDVADFQLSERVGIERKTTEDFLQSLIDGRLLQQMVSLKRNFEKPLVIVEGESLYGLRNINEKAIKGSLAALVIDFQIPILYSKDFKETAAFLISIATREQFEMKKEIALQVAQKPKTLAEMQQFLVESLPNVGPGIAKKLLERFGSVENVFNASESELKEVEKIGEKKASEIRKVITSKYSVD